MSCAAAQSLLAHLRLVFESAVAAMAKRCTRDGKLDPARLDQHQWICYELALGDADLVAATSAVEATAGVAGLDAELALVFAVDAIVSMLSRLQGIYLALDLDDTRVYQIVNGTDLRDLRHHVTQPERLAELGTSVAASTVELGDVALDDATAMARDAFRKFAHEVVAPVAADIHRRDLTVPEALLQPMRAMGVFGLSIPEEFGGSSAPGRENTPLTIAVTEALSEASLAAAGSLITRPEILARALLAGGTAEQKARWLPRIAAGEALCAISITEPDYGSDVANLSLRASPTEGGWLLNGAKTWCTFAGKADVLMVVARTHPDRSLGHRGLSVLLVEKPSYEGHQFDYVQPDGGRLAGRAIPTIGYRGMHSFDLAFENFFVPGANLIGGEGGVGRGFYLTMDGMLGGRIQTAGRALGVMRAALFAAIRYACDRRVFGAALVDYQLTQVKLALMASRFVACRHFAYAVARQVDNGGGRMEASLVKVFACRSAELVTREAMQIHGGMGYAEESAVSRYTVDARVLSIFEGAEETLALKVIARSLLEEALSK
jgi:(2S)-methylsuccinyl-CoA dehydrogenase